MNDVTPCGRRILRCGARIEIKIKFRIKLVKERLWSSPHIRIG